MTKFHPIYLFVFIIIVGCNPVKNQEIVKVEPHCISQQSLCSIQSDEFELEIMFDINKIVTETPINIFVDLKRFDSTKFTIKGISGFLEGKDMFMGKIPLFFSEQGNLNLYQSPLLLGSCSETEMVWLLNLKVELLDKYDNSLMTKSFTIELSSSRI